MDAVQVVVAHGQCATVRAGDVFLKIDGRQERSDREVEAMALAPVPTPDVLWRRPPVLALARVGGSPIARLGRPSHSSSAAWRSVGATVRALHDAPVPTWVGTRFRDVAAELEAECEWLLEQHLLPDGVAERNRAIADAVFRDWTPVFTHGDLQVAHVFVDDDVVTGVIDWTEAGPGDAAYDLAVLTLVHQEHLGDVLDGYGRDVDIDVIRAWWSARSLCSIRWLSEHGFDLTPSTHDGRPRNEIEVLLYAANAR